MTLEGKRILITGSSRGIGYSTAKKCLTEGAYVIGTSKSSPAPDELKRSDKYIHVRIDLSNFRELSGFLEKLDKDGWPDVIVNNAGIFRASNLTDSDQQWLEVWDQTIKVNLTAPSRICKRAIQYWLSRSKDGILINIASRAAYRGDTQEYSAYAASKGGLTALTKSISRQLGKKGIVAYSIAPGFIETDMSKNSMDVYGREYLMEGLSFDELTQPEEVAEMIAFISSGKVKHMTGTTFHINGGSYLI